MGDESEIERRDDAEVKHCVALLVGRFGRDWYDSQVEALGYLDSDDDLDRQSISEIASHAPVGAREKTEMFFELLSLHPQYGMLMLWELPKQKSDRKHFWQFVRDALDGDDERLAEAIMYWLWVDWFEDPRRVAEAWRETTGGTPTELRVQRVIESSGPVPWEQKASTLRSLTADRRWHLSVFRALQGAMFDVYGSTNRDDGVDLLSQLELPDDVPGLRSTRMAYDRLPEEFENWAHFQSKGGRSTWWRWGDDGEFHEQPGRFPGP